MVVPVVLAVVLLLAAGAFMALWLIERGDHKATTVQLGGVRTEIAGVDKEISGAQTAYTDAETRLKEVEATLAEHLAQQAKDKPCSDAGVQLNKVAVDTAAINAAIDVMMERCK
jgi:hypothetical protein